MHISDKLHFEPVENTFTQLVRCCNCDRQDFPQNWQIASLFPFSDSSDLNYIVCSDVCREAFLSHENLDIHVMIDVVRIADQLNKSLSSEFKKLLLALCN